MYPETIIKKTAPTIRMAGVDRGINTVENIRQASAVLRYGRQVSASLGKSPSWCIYNTVCHTTHVWLLEQPVRQTTPHGVTPPNYTGGTFDGCNWL